MDYLLHETKGKGGCYRRQTAKLTAGIWISAIFVILVHKSTVRQRMIMSQKKVSEYMRAAAKQHALGNELSY